MKVRMGNNYLFISTLQSSLAALFCILIFTSHLLLKALLMYLAETCYYYYTIKVQSPFLSFPPSTIMV